jgi:DnaJ-class molecular chaperone
MGLVMTETTFEEACRRADAERDARKRESEGKQGNARRCPYEVLGVTRDASPEQIKKVLYALVKKWHPDRNPDNKDECTERLKEINEAYEILKDPEQRAAYDKYGFTARGLGAAKHQRQGGPSFEDILAMFESMADTLVRLARNHAQLFHSPDLEPYAHAKVGGHRETYHVRSRAFELWLRRLYFHEAKESANSNSMAQALATIVMFAICEGDEIPIHVRTAEHPGQIYIDLGDNEWRAVKVTAGGWEVITDPPVRFVRSGSMRPLPLPVKGG